MSNAILMLVLFNCSQRLDLFPEPGHDINWSPLVSPATPKKNIAGCMLFKSSSRLSQPRPWSCRAICCSLPRDKHSSKYRNHKPRWARCQVIHDPCVDFGLSNCFYSGVNFICRAGARLSAIGDGRFVIANPCIDSWLSQ